MSNRQDVKSRLFSSPDQVRADMAQEGDTFAVRGVLVARVARLIGRGKVVDGIVESKATDMKGVAYTMRAQVEPNPIPLARQKWVLYKDEPIGIQMVDESQRVAEMYVSWDGRIAYLGEPGFVYNDQFDPADCKDVGEKGVGIDAANESRLGPKTREKLIAIAQKVAIGI